MTFYTGNIETVTLENEDYRKVLFTTDSQQLVVMCLLPNEEIGSEVHPKTTQFIRIESGQGKAIIGDKEIHLNDNEIVVIPPGVQHNVINTSSTEKLKLYTIYSPSEHISACVQPKKTDMCCAKQVADGIKKDYTYLCERSE